MQFIGLHQVTGTDIAHALRLTRRWRDTALNLASASVVAAVLVLVAHSLLVYLRAVATSPAAFLDLLGFRIGQPGLSFTVWLSVLVTLLLPVFLFYALRSLAETIWPERRIARVGQLSDNVGPTTYLVNDDGVRSTRQAGPDVFLPWSAFDGIRSDPDIISLTRKGQLRCFVPLNAFGEPHELVLAYIADRMRS